MTGAEALHVLRLPFDERCGVRSDPKDSPGATTANHHEAGEQPLERGAARFSVPARILRSRAPTEYSVSTANRRFPEPEIRRLTPGIVSTLGPSLQQRAQSPRRRAT